MSDLKTNIQSLLMSLLTNVKLIAVSKTKPVAQILEAYEEGQRAFAENYVQELCEKQQQLSSDIEWHFIGHLQSNKVKNIAPFVNWIHGVDSEKLLTEINKQAKKNNRTINCLLQMHIAQEETKFGFSTDELKTFVKQTNFSNYPNAPVCGLMAMASFTDDMVKVRNEFKQVKAEFDQLKNSAFASSLHFKELSMGMSSDWKIAVEEGSTMVRIGSAIFGERTSA